MKLRLITGLILLCLSLMAQASQNFSDNYQSIKPSVTTANPNKVEVVELFWYTCPHCYQFNEKYLNAWVKQKPSYVEFIQMPAVYDLSPKRTVFAKAFYTAEALGVLDKVNEPIFQAIHKKRRKINNQKALQVLFAKYADVSKADFDMVYNSFFINMKLRRAKEMTKKYGIRGVPAVIVNGKYRLGAQITGGYKNLMATIDHLIEKEYKAMSK
jgi:thiol:disulfide interchange protein DsbA